MRITLLVFLFIPTVIIAQPDSVEVPSPFQYQVVDSIPGLTADQIYSKAKIFITDHYMNPKRMIQLDDPISKTLIVKDANFHILIQGKGSGTAFGAPMLAGYVFFDIKIETKDNKSRITLYNFKHLGGDSYPAAGGNLDNDTPGFLMSKRQWKAIKKETAKRSIILIDQYKNALNKSNDF